MSHPLTERTTEMLRRLTAVTTPWLALVTGRDDGAAHAAGRERGDVPGWVLVTAMTVALVLAVWAIASEQITNTVRDALNQARFGG